MHMIQSQGRSQLVRAKYGKGEITLEKIREACMEEIISCGYHRTSVCDIVRRANLTRGAFYNYWNSLDDCLADLIVALREVIKNDSDGQEYARRLTEPSATIKKIRVALYLLTVKNSRYMRLPLALLQEKSIANEELKDQLRNYVMQVKNEYHDLITADQESGIFRADIDPDVIAVSIMNFFKGMFEKNVLEFEDFREPMLNAMVLFLESCLSDGYTARYPIKDLMQAEELQPA